MNWFPEELNWSGFRDAPTSLSEEHRNYDDPPFTQPPLQVTEIYLQVFDEQRWLIGHGNFGRVAPCAEPT